MVFLTFRILRRVGGLRRLLLGVLLILVGVYGFQTFILSGPNTADKSSRPEFDSVNGRKLSNVAPVFVNPPNENNNNSSVEASKFVPPPIAVEIATKEPVKQEVQAQKATKKVCGSEVDCDAGELVFRLSGSVGDSGQPHACLNDLSLFHSDKLAKGLNVVILDELTHQVLEIQYFDLLSEVKKDSEFISFISEFVAKHRSNQQIILVASWGDFADRLTEKSRTILQKFGSRQIGDVKKGNSFVLLGQKGLVSGQAIEEVGVVGDKDSEGAAEVSGCLKLPIGEIDPKMSFEDEDSNREALNLAKNFAPGPLVSRRDKIIYGQELPHCGMKDACPKGFFALSVYSGKHKDDVPKMCINGRFVIDRNLNKAGRGLNIVVLNSTAVDVLRVGHFDTYAEDSSTLEIFLEQTIPNEMIVVLSFDEASTRLSSMAKQMFYELGSGLVQNLKFRASWYFVGQRGISGFTPFEELNFAKGTEWSQPVDEKLCVPVKLDGTKVRPDPVVQTKNEARRNFCKRNDGYENFCDETHVDKLLIPTVLFNKSMEGNPIFKVPLLVVAGLAHNSLRLCLETILRQPGIDPKMVLVSFDENYGESGELAELFSFQTMAVNSSASYTGQLSKSMEAVWTHYPDANATIVIEEELMLTGDFLVYMSQLLPVLKKDESILSVSAWNDNGFVGSSTRPDTAYRIEGFPGLGFMIRKKTYQDILANQMEKCCSKRVWDGWSTGQKSAIMIVPDVSRMIRRHSDGLGVLEPHLEDLFHRDRAYTKESESWLFHPDYLTKQQYDTQLNYSLATAKPIESESLRICLTSKDNSKTVTLPKSDNKRQPFSVYFEQISDSDHKLLRILCECFGLFSSPDMPARGVYKSVLRFSYQEHPMFLVGSRSPFFGQKPSKYQIFNGKL